MRSIEPSGPGIQGQGVRQAPLVHCDSSAAFLAHPGLKGSARRHKIPVQVFVLTHLTHCAELCLRPSHIVPARGEASRLWILLKSLWYGLYHVLSPFNFLCYCREY